MLIIQLTVCHLKTFKQITQTDNFTMFKAAFTQRRRNFKPALFLRLGLPSTLIRHKNGAFRKRSSNWRNFKTTALRFIVAGKHFENTNPK